MAIHVVTGLGPDGRSAILSREDKVLRSARAAGLEIDDTDVHSDDDSSEILIAKLNETTARPQVARVAKDPVLPLPTPPGGTLWMELKFGGTTAYDLHRTNSIDHHYILGGEVELLLETGSVTLVAGDTVVIPGILHAWRSTKGWTTTIFMIGLDAL